jgi:DNA processing protein
VVSGLARGVDAAAHEGALEAGATLAFQACGPDRLYPPEHRRLAGRIARRGAVVSELPLGTPPRPAYFPLRNRLISGLAEAVVVVEARERSGSLVTARHAAEQGTDVYAVPGPITAPTSRGPHRLLRDGAIPLTTPEDLLEDLKLRPAPGGGAHVLLRQSPAAAPADPLARAVLAALEDAPLTRDELARRLGSPVGALRAALSMLELEGRVTEDRDGRLTCASPRGGAWL